MRIHTHPGEILLEEFLKPLGITTQALSLAIGVPASRITDIIQQRNGISADMAARLARYFGTSAIFWCNLQSAHDLSVVEATRATELENITPLLQPA